MTEITASINTIENDDDYDSLDVNDISYSIISADILHKNKSFLTSTSKRTPSISIDNIPLLAMATLDKQILGKRMLSRNIDGNNIYKTLWLRNNAEESNSLLDIWGFAKNYRGGYITQNNLSDYSNIVKRILDDMILIKVTRNIKFIQVWSDAIQVPGVADEFALVLLLVFQQLHPLLHSDFTIIIYNFLHKNIFALDDQYFKRAINSCFMLLMFTNDIELKKFILNCINGNFSSLLEEDVDTERFTNIKKELWEQLAGVIKEKISL
jgi:hypothetical protein